MMRRRQEREESERINEDPNETSDGHLAQEVKPEVQLCLASFILGIFLS